MDQTIREPGKEETVSDEELMLSYAAGDAASFDLLYARHRHGLFRFILRQCHDRTLTEEIFQEVWMNVIQSRARYSVMARFRTYLFTLAHYRLVDFFRRQGGEATSRRNDDDEDPLDNIPGSRTDEPDVQVLSRQQSLHLLKLIDELPAAQREAFLMHEEGGLSVEEIASASGVNPETAKSRLRYALAKLRAGLQRVMV